MVDVSESDILFDDPKTKSKKRPTRQQKAGESNRPGASGKTKGEKNAVDNNIKQNPKVQSVFQWMEKTVEISWQNRRR